VDCDASQRALAEARDTVRPWMGEATAWGWAGMPVSLATSASAILAVPCLCAAPDQPMCTPFTPPANCTSVLAEALTATARLAISLGISEWVAAAAAQVARPDADETTGSESRRWCDERNQSCPGKDEAPLLRAWQDLASIESQVDGATRGISFGSRVALILIRLTAAIVSAATSITEAFLPRPLPEDERVWPWSQACARGLRVLCESGILRRNELTLLLQTSLEELAVHTETATHGASRYVAEVVLLRVSASLYGVEATPRECGVSSPCMSTRVFDVPGDGGSERLALHVIRRAKALHEGDVCLQLVQHLRWQTVC